MTGVLRATRLRMMRFPKAILTAVVAAAFAGYAFDCGAEATPEQAMQCCETMPCPPHGHGQAQDCCKEMPTMHAPFVKPPAAQDDSLAPQVFVVLPAAPASPSVDSATPVLNAHCHAPPGLQKAASPPLRI